MYLGIDIGTSSIKALLTDGQTKTSVRKIYRGLDSDTHHPVALVEAAFVEAVQEVLKGTDHNLAGISICGHGPSIVIIDSEGQALTDIITWQEKEAVAEAKILQDKLAGFAKDATSYEAKVLYQLNHHPERLENGGCVLYVKDYFIYRLTNLKVIDHVCASTIRFYDKKTDKWKTDFLNIDESIFPKKVRADRLVGGTNTSFAKRCLIPDDTPVVAGSIDAYCEILGAGGVHSGDLIDGTGTSTCLSRISEYEESKDEHVLPGLSVEMKSMSSTGKSIKWLKNTFKRDVFDQLRLADLEPSKLIFLPYLSGERSPIWDEAVSGLFMGLTPETDDRQFALGVLEGISYALRHNLDMFDGKTKKTVRAIGGGASNDLLLQLKADITRKTYWQMEELDAGAYGAALLCAISEKPDQAAEIIDQWVGVSKIFEPRVFNQAYEQQYEIYKALYPCLKGLFHQLHEI